MRALLHRHSELLLMAADISNRVVSETALVWHHVQENEIRRWCMWYANDISAFIWAIYNHQTSRFPKEAWTHSLWTQWAKFSIIFLSSYVTLFPLMKANHWARCRSTVSAFTTAAEEVIWVVFFWILPQQEDMLMSLFDTLRSSLHKLRSVAIRCYLLLSAVLILNSYEHTHPWRFYFISLSHPCSDVKQDFDPGEHVMAGWVVPACKEQNLQICFVFSHGPTIIRLLPFQKTTTWPWKASTCIYLNAQCTWECVICLRTWLYLKSNRTKGESADLSCREIYLCM